MLKEYLTRGPILIYPGPNKEYYLFTDTSKYTWSAIFMQQHSTQSEDGKMHMQLHPVTFQSGTFKGSQLNWATLKKEAYAIYMVFRKCSYYLGGAKTFLRSDHAPLQKFLAGKTLNNTVNN